MTYSTLASQQDLGGRLQPARSIPNFPKDTSESLGCASSDSFHLARSSSHPAEMWSRDVLASDAQCKSSEQIIETSTQTQNPLIQPDLKQIEQFILDNRQMVLRMLSIDTPFKIDYNEVMQSQSAPLIPIQETISSPEISSPNEFIYGGSSSVWSLKNSSNKNAENCRSTDALLCNSSDDCLKSDENLSLINRKETVNFSIIKEGSFKSLKNRSDKSSSSNNSISSAATTTPKASDNELGSRSNYSTNTSRQASWKESSQLYRNDYQAIQQPPPNVSIEYPAADLDDLNEKCALLCSDVRRGSSASGGRSSIADVHKRNHLAPRAPVNYRFSAGDADKLEKGIKPTQSTRSLKES